MVHTFMSENCLSGKYRASVVIPSYNRGHSLTMTIESLFHQNFPCQEYEILVVDDGSTDGTAEMVQDLQNRALCRLTYIRNDQNLGPAESRNRGIEMANGDIIAFTDSDCIADPDWLRCGLEKFEDGIGFVSGKVLPIPGQPIRFFTSWKGSVLKEDMVYPTCNIFYRREILLNVGGFNKQFKKATCEDAELAWRVKRAEWQNVFAEDAVIFHEVTDRPPLKWLFATWGKQWVPLLLKLTPEIRSPLLKRIFPHPFWMYRLMILGIVLVPLFRSPLPLLLFLPILYIVWKRLRIDFRSPQEVIKGMAKFGFIIFRNLVDYTALIYGSIKHRYPVF